MTRDRVPVYAKARVALAAPTSPTPDGARRDPPSPRVVALVPPVVSIGADLELRAGDRGWTARANRTVAIGGVELSPGIERVVVAGDRITLPGGEDVELAEPEEPTDLATFQLALRHVDRIVRERPSTVPCVSVVEGRESGMRLELLEEHRVYIIGRSQEAALSIADGDASREHCAVQRRGDVALVWDLASKTGTFMGAQRITDVRIVWESSVMVRIGKTVLRLTKPSPKLADEVVAEARATETKLPDAEPEDQASKSPHALPAPAGQASVAAVPRELEPAPKRTRDVTTIVMWGGAALLAILSVGALVWIFR